MTKDTEFTKNEINNDENHNQCIYTGPALNNKSKSDHIWTERACKSYFYLHPFMGSNSLNLIGKKILIKLNYN